MAEAHVEPHQMRPGHIDHGLANAILKALHGILRAAHEQDPELVAADATQDVGAASGHGKRAGELPQGLVAGGMPRARR